MVALLEIRFLYYFTVVVADWRVGLYFNWHGIQSASELRRQYRTQQRLCVF